MHYAIVRHPRSGERFAVETPVEGKYSACVFCGDPAHRHKWLVLGAIIGPCIDCPCPAWGDSIRRIQQASPPRAAVRTHTQQGHA